MKKESVLKKLYTLKDLAIQIKEGFRDVMADISQNPQYVKVVDERLEEMIEKIDRCIDNISKEKVCMALFGAFSDGKSSILSAITKNFNIKIAPEPTTDKVTYYEYGDFFIVDTPGTFSHDYLHDEKTRKYISEANVILFVVDAVNPIKDSHKALVKEVLIDMKKLENTIFVLNKMDNVVTDLEDEQEYRKMTEIKREALLYALEYLNLSSEDKRKIRVIAVSANPNNLGFDFWSKRWNEYMKLSKIENLVKEIQDVYQKDRERIIYHSGVSVILDTVSELEKMINPEDVKTYVNQLNELEESIKDSYHRMENWINQAFTLYRSRLERIQQDYLNKLDLCRNHTELLDFVENYVGEDKTLEKMMDRILAEVHDILQVTAETIKEFDRNIETKAIMSVSFRNIEGKTESSEIKPINLQEDSLEDTSKAISSGSEVLLSTGDYILSLSKLQIMHGLLHFRKISGLSHFIKFTGRGTHMIWASKWASLIQGLGVAMNILGILGLLLSGVMKLLEENQFTDKKMELRNYLESAFSQMATLEFFLGLVGINWLDLRKHFEAYVNQISEQKNNYQRCYEELKQIFGSLRNLKDSA